MFREVKRKVRMFSPRTRDLRFVQLIAVTFLVFIISGFLSSNEIYLSGSACFAAETGQTTSSVSEPAKSTESALAAAALPPPVSKPVTLGQDGIPLVSNVFTETDLRQALSDISAQTGVTIMADATVQGMVSADIKDLPLEKALNMLLMSGGFSFTKLDDYYLVGLPDPTNPNFSLLTKTEYFQLKHTTPATIVSLLSQQYGKYISAIGAAPQTVSRRDQQNNNRPIQSQSAASGTIPGVPELYGVVITAPQSMIPRIKADIVALDKAPAQIMIEAVIIELNQDALKDLGLNWASRWLSQDMSSGGANLVYSSIANNEIVKLTALVKNGQGKLRANPRLATEEGNTAELEVGKESYFSILSGSLAYQYATIETIKSGIFLRVTPRVNQPEDEVVVRIEPEVRDVTGKGLNGLPEITFRRAVTNLRVKNGESIVIGGLMNESSNESVNKIPILGDIPLIGGLFRSKSTIRSKSEVIIIVTPHIITETGGSQNFGSPSMWDEIKNVEPIKPPKKSEPEEEE
ncbi:MAG: type II secretion system protein GspD [Armatimonadota bacterium]